MSCEFSLQHSDSALVTKKISSPNEGSDSVVLIATSEEYGDVGVLHLDTSRFNMETAATDSECSKKKCLLNLSVIAED